MSTEVSADRQPPKCLLRFHQDVIDLQPKAVVILAGTNDIAGNTGPSTLKNDRGQYCCHDRDSTGSQNKSNIDFRTARI